MKQIEDYDMVVHIDAALYYLTFIRIPYVGCPTELHEVYAEDAESKEVLISCLINASSEYTDKTKTAVYSRMRYLLDNEYACSCIYYLK